MQKYLPPSTQCISNNPKNKFSKLFQTLVAIILFGLPIAPVWAGCVGNGDISGANGALILGSGGCADDPNNKLANIFAGASINAVGNGLTAPIAAGHNPWNITNAGSITATGSGIDLQDGGDTVTNQVGATITSTGANGITAAGGVASITLINAGTINGELSGALLLGGGTVINQAGGVIEGKFTGISFSANGPSPSGGPSLVENAGTIESTGPFDNAIVLGLGGTVINYAGGVITGNGAGVLTSVNASTIYNAGTIGSASTSTSVGLGAGGTVNNYAGGQLVSASRGVSIDGGSGIINNDGSITASVGRAIDFGVTSSGGTVNNYANGFISGGGTRSIIFEGGPGVVNNAGTISGGSIAAIQMMDGNSAVNNSGIINGDVVFTNSNDQFLMTAGQMTGQLLMGTGGHETATFQNVTDANIGNISLFDGGGGGDDQLNFDHSQHTGGSEMINWETINLNDGSVLTLASDLTLGGASADTTATLNINGSTLNANDALNSIIEAGCGSALVNNAGIINLTSPAANNSLIIRGNYTGNNGLLVLNTVLNSDDSPSDKLVIDGQNGTAIASGNTFIAVHNLGGTGAQTNSNGILVVQAINNAITNPSAFTLNNPLRAGAFDYRLFRGGVNANDPTVAQDWFLRSTFNPTPPPGPTPGPTPPNPSPILGPELSVYGSALPTAMDMSRDTLGTLHERVGDESNLIDNNSLSNNRFANGGWLRTFAQPYHEKYSSIVNPVASGTVSGIQGGLDLYRNQNAQGLLNLIGVYAAYVTANPDIDGLITNANATADIQQSTGSVDLDSPTGGVYWTHFWHSGTYLDLVAQASSYSGNASSFRTSMGLSGEGTTESAELGYPIALAPSWILEPETQVMYEYAHFQNSNDFFSSVNLGSSDAVLGRIGTRLKYTTQVHNHLLQLYARANLWSDLAGNNATAVYAGVDSIATSAKASWAQLGGGLTLNLNKNLGVYGFVDDIASLSGNHRTVSGVDGGLGLRLNW